MGLTEAFDHPSGPRDVVHYSDPGKINYIFTFDHADALNRDRSLPDQPTRPRSTRHHVVGFVFCSTRSGSDPRQNLDVVHACRHIRKDEVKRVCIHRLQNEPDLFRLHCVETILVNHKAAAFNAVRIIAARVDAVLVPHQAGAQYTVKRRRKLLGPSAVNHPAG